MRLIIIMVFTQTRHWVVGYENFANTGGWFPPIVQHYNGCSFTYEELAESLITILKKLSEEIDKDHEKI